MTNRVVIGAQWGDEGKANITEYIKACQGVRMESFKASTLAQAMANLKKASQSK